MKSKRCKRPAVLHKRVNLIIGLIFKDEEALKKAEVSISKKFGPIDLHGEVTAFSHTNYYNNEFGENLKRKFISLKRLVSPENICRVKLITDKIEKRLSKSGRRTVNIDPGYIAEGKLILLTTKDHSHRVYLKKGIYAESTLKFHNGTFVPWETTYPDYRTDAYINILNKIRGLYKKKLVHK